MTRAPAVAAIAALCLLVLSTPVPAIAATEGYYRFPSLRGNTIVFTAEGDLWSVAASGGVARRLTTHPSLEAQARISPDGRQVAFVASYDGQPDVYVMPLAGGEPKRLTFEGPRVLLSGWTHDGRVAYASDNAVGPSWRFMPRLVDPATGRTEELPIADANEIVIAADGTVYFTRFGLHVTGDNARRYRGGAMAELWRWRPGSDDEAIRLAPDLAANLTRPMLRGGGLLALADLDGIANLVALGAGGAAPQALTRHVDLEVRSPAIDGDRVVYQHGADLRLLDLATGEDRIVPIRLGSDFEQRRERFVRNPLNFLTGITLAPDGSRVVIAARGRVATAGLGPVRRIDLMTPATARVREARLSRDGRVVHAIVDAEGRSEIWALPADGSPGGRRLTNDGSVHRWRLQSSPDGRLLAHEDKLGRLFVLDTESGRNRLVDESPYAGDAPRDGLSWSKDSRWLAFARPDSRALRDQIVVLEVATGRKLTVTSDRYESSAPVFAPDGRWLYFLSDRNFQPTPGGPWGDRNMGPMFDRRTRIYALGLQPGLRFPFQPRDELAPAAEPGEDDGDASHEKRDAGGGPRRGDREAAGSAPAIVLEGLAARLFEVPVGPGNYTELSTDGERLYVLDRLNAPDARPQLLAWPISDDPGKPKTVADNLVGYALSADRTRLMLIGAGGQGPQAAPVGDVLVVPVADKLPDDLAKVTVRLGDWSVAVDPDLEWLQMFDEAWRMHRAFSFDPAMRGIDWDATRAKYAPLVARVAERSELDDLLAQMIGELGLLHSQVRPGDLRADPDTPAPAWLGAKLEIAEGGVRIARIYRTDPELPSERSPLAQPGVDAREGDVIVAINGRPVATPGDVQAAIRQRAGQQVLLSLRRGKSAARAVVVVPVATERDQALRYGDWVQSSRARVDAGGLGRIGYLHLRAMGAADVAAFAREFHAAIDREGLIVDVRRNRGGNIDSWVLNALMRRAWAFWQPPLGTPYWNMQQAFRGHLVVLADQLTYSDGETFSAGARALGLAPVIGMRTAGAGIWLSDRNRLSDNGAARIAEFGQFSIDGRWLIEGTGVSPDMQVDNLPVATARGADAQLDAAIAWLMRKLAEQPVTPLRAEPIPPLGTNAHDGTPPSPPSP